MGQASTHALIFAGGLFLGMLMFLETGRRIGTRRSAREAERSRKGAGMLDGAVFALLGLLIAFTFSGAGTRFDLEYPRLGLIRMENSDRVLIQLRESMNNRR